MRDGGWICAGWPAEYGGRGLSALQVAAMAQVFHEERVPRITRGLAEALVGPAIIAHGTPEQKARFLPRIVSGEDSYCQGFSEPEAGSDLASLRTRGVVAGDRIHVTGQKIWTSDSASANMIFVLCRTDPDAPKHRGISYVLLPLHDNGIEIRPLRQMNGGSDFAEVFLDDAQAPLFNVIGGINNGWPVAMTVLANERGAAEAVGYTSYEVRFWDLVRVARARGLDRDQVMRRRLAEAYAQIGIMRYSGLRSLADMKASRLDGPQASIGKLSTTEFNKRFCELALDVLGPEAMLHSADSSYWLEWLFTSRAMTIAGGSSEIQRNIISERVLGLPRG
jgi:alkylation response protein AidB-like acyl-CoA dehydrogenase